MNKYGNVRDVNTPKINKFNDRNPPIYDKAL